MRYFIEMIVAIVIFLILCLMRYLWNFEEAVLMGLAIIATDVIFNRKKI